MEESANRRGGCTRAAGAVEEYAHVTSTQELVAQARRVSGDSGDRRRSVFKHGGPVRRPCAEREGTASEASSSVAPATADPNFTGMAYPETGEAPCGTADYTGILKKITAIDSGTVEFQLCAPDPAFLPKVAFSVFGIWDSDYLPRTRRTSRT